MTDRPLTPGPKVRVEGRHRYADMPRKKWRAHRWIGVATYVLSEDAAAAAHDPAQDAHFDIENLADLGIGCLDCEQPYTRAKDTPCTAEPFKWQRVGDA